MNHEFPLLCRELRCKKRVSWKMRRTMRRMGGMLTRMILMVGYPCSMHSVGRRTFCLVIQVTLLTNDSFCC